MRASFLPEIYLSIYLSTRSVGGRARGGLKRTGACLGVLLVATSCWLNFSRGQLEEVQHQEVQHQLEELQPVVLHNSAARPVTLENGLQLPASNESTALVIRSSQEHALPQSAQGYCTQTKDNDPGDCEGGLQGSWSTGIHGISSLAHCAVRSLDPLTLSGWILNISALSSPTSVYGDLT
jgi:hypothetical protein